MYKENSRKIPFLGENPRTNKSALVKFRANKVYLMFTSGFGRVMRPCAARSCLFSLIDTQKRALRTPAPVNRSSLLLSSSHFLFIMKRPDHSSLQPLAQHLKNNSVATGRDRTPGLPTMPALGRERDTKELAKQLQIGTFGT
jgi:hypothetical protein